MACLVSFIHYFCYYTLTKLTYSKLGLDENGLEIKTTEDTIFTPINTTPDSNNITDVASNVVGPDVSSSDSGTIRENGIKDADS